MKVHIKSEEHTIRLALPNRMIFSSLALRIANRVADGKDLVMLSSLDLRRIRKTVKKMKKLHPGMAIVDIEDEDGNGIKIYL